MSSITRNALSTVWKICGVTRRAWNWNQLTPRVESGMRGTRCAPFGKRGSASLRTVAAAVSAGHFCRILFQRARCPLAPQVRAVLALDGYHAGISSAKATLMQQQPETQQVAWLVPRPA